MNAQNIQLVDVYGVWYQPWWHSTWFYCSIVIFMCAVLFFMLYYMYRAGWFRKNISYDQQALRQLQELAGQTYVSPEQLRKAYFQLTLIVKTYLAHRYCLVLTDKTDIEVIPLLTGLLDQPMQQVLAEFLQRSFYIKFAHDVVVEPMLQDDIEFLKKFIVQTQRDLDKVGNS